MSENGEIRRTNVTKLVEAGAMVAIATILSMIKLIDLPYGGSVTIACMLPVVIISYRNGIKWGLLTGLVFAIIQQLFGLNTLSYVTTWQSILAVILLDYIVAFTVVGLGGIFKKNQSQPKALMYGTIFVCVLRYICHVISGATVWAGLSIPTNAALAYSFGYNATYMIPETIVTATLAYFVGTILDFGSTTIRPLRKEQTAGLSVPKLVSAAVLAFALIFDSVAVFSNLQNAESGEFDITGLSAVNWTALIAVSVVALAVAVGMHFLAKKGLTKSHENA